MTKDASQSPEYDKDERRFRERLGKMVKESRPRLSVRPPKREHFPARPRRAYYKARAAPIPKSWNTRYRVPGADTDGVLGGALPAGADRGGLVSQGQQTH